MIVFYDCLCYNQKRGNAMFQQLTKKEKRLAIVRLFIFIIVIGLMIWATIAFLPVVSKLGSEESRMEFQAEIASKGFMGVLTVLGLQILQIVVAVIPGQPMEIISGMLYGTIGGMILCLVGIFIGTAIVYFLVRKVGTDFIQLFFSKEQIEGIKNKKVFKNSKKFELLLFIIFTIPLIPKDIFIYLGGLSPVKPKRFLTIATIGRIPGLFVTVYAGDKLSQGEFIISVILVAVFLIVGLIGYYISDRAQNRLEEES